MSQGSWTWARLEFREIGPHSSILRHFSNIAFKIWEEYASLSHQRSLRQGPLQASKNAVEIALGCLWFPDTCSEISRHRSIIPKEIWSKYQTRRFFFLRYVLRHAKSEYFSSRCQRNDVFLKFENETIFRFLPDRDFLDVSRQFFLLAFLAIQPVCATARSFSSSCIGHIRNLTKEEGKNEANRCAFFIANSLFSWIHFSSFRFANSLLI